MVTHVSCISPNILQLESCSISYYTLPFSRSHAATCWCGGCLLLCWGASAQDAMQEMLKPKKPAFCSLSPVQIAGQLLALGDSIDICCNMLVSWMKSPALGCLCPEYHAGDIVLDTSAFCSLNSV